MTEERPVRDRLGEALRREWYRRVAKSARQEWGKMPEEVRQRWMREADIFRRDATDCGLKIELAFPSPDAGGRG